MNRSLSTVARRALCVGFGCIGVAFAGAAAAQTYSYEPYSGSYESSPPPAPAPYSYSYQSPVYTYPSGQTYQYSYERSTSAPSYSYETTTSAPAYSPAYSYESTTSAPAYSYSYSAPVYSAPADPYAGGITVYGRRTWRGGTNDHPELSRAVGYRDLDLRTDAGVAELKARIARTAGQLCRELGEPRASEQNTTVLPSCQAAARDTAYQQVQTAIDSARYWARR